MEPQDPPLDDQSSVNPDHMFNPGVPPESRDAPLPSTGIPHQALPSTGIPHQALPSTGIPHQALPSTGIPHQAPAVSEGAASVSCPTESATGPATGHLSSVRHIHQPDVPTTSTAREVAVGANQDMADGVPSEPAVSTVAPSRPVSADSAGSRPKAVASRRKTGPKEGKSGPKDDKPKSKGKSGPKDDKPKSKGKSGPKDDKPKSKGGKSGPKEDMSKSKEGNSGPKEDKSKSKEGKSKSKEDKSKSKEGNSGPKEDKSKSKEGKSKSKEGKSKSKEDKSKSKEGNSGPKEDKSKSKEDKSKSKEGKSRSKGSLKKATPSADAATPVAEENPDLFNSLENTFVEIGTPEEPEANLTRSSNLSPVLPSVSVDLCRVKLTPNQVKEAIKSAKGVVRKDGTEAENASALSSAVGVSSATFALSSAIALFSVPVADPIVPPTSQVAPIGNNMDSRTTAPNSSEPARDIVTVKISVPGKPTSTRSIRVDPPVSNTNAREVVVQVLNQGALADYQGAPADDQGASTDDLWAPADDDWAPADEPVAGPSSGGSTRTYSLRNINRIPIKEEISSDEDDDFIPEMPLTRKIKTEPDYEFIPDVPPKRGRGRPPGKGRKSSTAAPAPLTVVISRPDEGNSNVENVEPELDQQPEPLPSASANDVRQWILGHSTPPPDLVDKSKPLALRKQEMRKEVRKQDAKLVGGSVVLNKRLCRCRTCEGCTRRDCLECIYCEDMVKYGGPGVKKQSCLKRRCLNPTYVKAGSANRVKVEVDPEMPRKRQPKKKPEDKPGAAANQGDEAPNVPAKRGRKRKAEEGDVVVVKIESEPPRKKRGRPPGSGKNKGDPNDPDKPDPKKGPAKKGPAKKEPAKKGPAKKEPAKKGPAKNPVPKKGTETAADGAVKDEGVDKPSAAAEARRRRIPEHTIDHTTDLVPAMNSTIRQMRQRPLGEDDGPTRLIPHIAATCDSEKVWRQGFGVISTTGLPVVDLCFICGSRGHHDMKYCGVCCEPFHPFCVKDETVAVKHGLGWTCYRCITCEICKEVQGGVDLKSRALLKCPTCLVRVHPECIPIKMAKGAEPYWYCANCAICAGCRGVPKYILKCFEGKFLFLCRKCDVLKTKGKFCNTCKVPYHDGEEENMMKCTRCSRHVHTDCAGLSDEEVHLIRSLPQPLDFICEHCHGKEVKQIMDRVEKQLKEQDKREKKAAAEAAKVMAQEQKRAIREAKSRARWAAKNKSKAQKQDPAAGDDAAPSRYRTRGTTKVNTVKEEEPVDLEKIEKEKAKERARKLTPPVVKWRLKLRSLKDNDFYVFVDTLRGDKSAKYLGTISLTSLANLFRNNKKDVPEAKAKQAESANPGAPNSTLPDQPQPDQSQSDQPQSDQPQPAPSRGADPLDLGFSAEECAAVDMTAFSLDGILNTFTNEVEQGTSDRGGQGDPPGGRDDPVAENARLYAACHFDDGAPHDLASVLAKIKKKKYKSLAEVVTDITRILNAAGVRELYQTEAHAKYNQAFRERFVQELELRPWYKGGRPMLVDPVNWVITEPEEMDEPPDEEEMIYEEDEKAGYGNIGIGGYEEPDTRVCILCREVGDQFPNDAGRLIYASQDDWIHVNCARWSAEVVETKLRGFLENVFDAVQRSKRLPCTKCQKKGATVGCQINGCNENYHFMCARQLGCGFLKSKRMYCSKHVSSIDEDEEILTDFTLLRPIIIDTTEMKTLKWQKGLLSNDIQLSVGTMTLKKLGDVDSAYEHETHIVPTNYSATRLFWSTVDPYKVAKYTFTVKEIVPEMPPCKAKDLLDKAVIYCHDEGHPNAVPAEDINEQIKKLFEDINRGEEEARDAYYQKLTDDLQLPPPTKVVPKPEPGPSEAGKPEAGPSEAGKSEAGPSEAGKPEAGPSEAGKPEAGPSEAGPSEKPEDPAVVLGGEAYIVTGQVVGAVQPNDVAEMVAPGGAVQVAGDVPLDEDEDIDITTMPHDGTGMSLANAYTTAIATGKTLAGAYTTAIGASRTSAGAYTTAILTPSTGGGVSVSNALANEMSAADVGVPVIGKPEDLQGGLSAKTLKLLSLSTNRHSKHQDNPISISAPAPIRPTLSRAAAIAARCDAPPANPATPPKQEKEEEEEEESSPTNYQKLTQMAARLNQAAAKARRATKLNNRAGRQPKIYLRWQGDDDDDDDDQSQDLSTQPSSPQTNTINLVNPSNATATSDTQLQATGSTATGTPKVLPSTVTTVIRPTVTTVIRPTVTTMIRPTVTNVVSSTVAKPVRQIGPVSLTPRHPLGQPVRVVQLIRSRAPGTQVNDLSSFTRIVSNSHPGMVIRPQQPKAVTPTQTVLSQPANSLNYLPGTIKQNHSQISIVKKSSGGVSSTTLSGTTLRPITVFASNRPANHNSTSLVSSLLTGHPSPAPPRTVVVVTRPSGQPSGPSLRFNSPQLIQQTSAIPSRLQHSSVGQLQSIVSTVSNSQSVPVVNSSVHSSVVPGNPALSTPVVSRRVAAGDEDDVDSPEILRTDSPSEDSSSSSTHSDSVSFHSMQWEPEEECSELVSPPKIVITDCSGSVAKGTREKLKSFVQRRSSTEDLRSVGQSEAVSEVPNESMEVDESTLTDGPDVEMAASTISDGPDVEMAASTISDGPDVDDSTPAQRVTRSRSTNALQSALNKSSKDSLCAKVQSQVSSNLSDVVNSTQILTSTAEAVSVGAPCITTTGAGSSALDVVVVPSSVLNQEEGIQQVIPMENGIELSYVSSHVLPKVGGSTIENGDGPVGISQVSLDTVASAIDNACKKRKWKEVSDEEAPNHASTGKGNVVADAVSAMQKSLKRNKVTVTPALAGHAPYYMDESDGQQLAPKGDADSDTESAVSPDQPTNTLRQEPLVPKRSERPLFIDRDSVTVSSSDEDSSESDSSDDDSSCDELDLPNPLITSYSPNTARKPGHRPATLNDATIERRLLRKRRSTDYKVAPRYNAIRDMLSEASEYIIDRYGPRRKDKLEKFLMFEITSDEGFSTTKFTFEDACNELIDKVQAVRREKLAPTESVPESYHGIRSMNMFGLNNHTLKYMMEQMEGMRLCFHYKFRYHNKESLLVRLPVFNDSGACRTEYRDPKKHFGEYSFLESMRTFPDHLEPAFQDARRKVDAPLPAQFKGLEKFAHKAYRVAKSRIHGRGLYTVTAIEAGEMIIEYAGERVRNIIADMREEVYESKGIGCYMFRLNDHWVIDSTMKGNVARFINHCCEPNCTSKVMRVNNTKRIVIFAAQRIEKGAELTYDYKFPKEEDFKIPCICGAKKCKKYLN